MSTSTSTPHSHSTSASARSTSPYNASLANHTLFKVDTHRLSGKEQALLAYQRAKLVGQSHNLTAHDLLHLTPKFWNLHTDPINALDGATASLLTIQYNLACGTIVEFACGGAKDGKSRRELDGLIEDLLRFRVIGQFMLTEVGHGLDVDNLETQAVMQPNGEFVLSSPTPSSAKYMPPTPPAGIPAIAVVFARLLVNGENWGIRPFIVPINNGREMCQGVIARVLPHRGLSSPLNHSITVFKNVRLPASSLLGPLDKESYNHETFMASIWRTAVGSIALGGFAIPFSKVCTFIGAKYSLRRTVGPPKRRTPIIAFRTQQIPILTAVAQTYVLEAFHRWAVERFTDVNQKRQQRHAIATIFKALAIQSSTKIALAVSERCGAQGVQGVNMMARLHSETRGVSIAEGDVLVLSIKLAIELLLGRYTIPATTNPSSLLALHEAGLLSKFRAILKAAPNHRSEEVNKRIVPNALRIVDAIGNRMAYDAAVSAGVSADIIALFVANAMQQDAAWYAENAGVSSAKQEAIMSDALDALLPQLESLVNGMDVKPYAQAPIVSEERWEEFVAGLDVVEGKSAYNPLRVIEESQMKISSRL